MKIPILARSVHLIPIQITTKIQCFVGQCFFGLGHADGSGTGICTDGDHVILSLGDQGFHGDHKVIASTTERKTETERQTETDRQRQTDRQAETDRDRERQRETDRDRERQRETERYCGGMFSKTVKIKFFHCNLSVLLPNVQLTKYWFRGEIE